MEHLANADIAGHAGNDDDHDERQGDVRERDDRRVVRYPQARDRDQRGAEADPQSVSRQRGERRLNRIMVTSSPPLAPIAFSAPNFSRFSMMKV